MLKPKLITPAAAAKILGLTTSAVRARGKTGKLREVKIGGIRFYDQEQVEQAAAYAKEKAARATRQQEAAS